MASNMETNLIYSKRQCKSLMTNDFECIIALAFFLFYIMSISLPKLYSYKQLGILDMRCVHGFVARVSHYTQTLLLFLLLLSFITPEGSTYIMQLENAKN